MKPTWCTIFSAYFISFIYYLYMFRKLSKSIIRRWQSVVQNNKIPSVA